MGYVGVLLLDWDILVEVKVMVLDVVGVVVVFYFGMMGDMMKKFFG